MVGQASEVAAVSLVNKATVIDYSPLYYGGDRVKVPSDIDGVFEIKDNFLVLECKSGNAEVSIGQRWMLEKLARREGFRVLIVQIKGTRLPSGAMLFEPEAFIELGRPYPEWQRTSITLFRDYIYRWQAHAYRNPGRNARLDLKDLPRYQP